MTNLCASIRRHPKKNSPKEIKWVKEARVIKETIGSNLPKGFQKSEFLLENGFIDFIVDRRNLKNKIYKLDLQLGHDLNDEKFVKKWFKENKEQVDVLMSYSDPKVGHLGGIYQATNWLYQGDSMRMVDAYSVRLEEDSEWLHSRTVFSRWGSNNLDILKKKIGKTFWVREEPRKHRYLYLLCNKKHKKNIMKTLKHPILPYPKNKKEINLKVEEINV